MAKIIKVDFSDRGKELYYMKKQRRKEKRWQQREDKFYRMLERQ